MRLAEAQHALAREYGFDSWPKLLHHVESLRPGSRMLRPAELKSDEKLLWSPGRGTDVWAAKYGQLEMVEFLLERGAPKSLPDDPPWATPLAWAIKRGHDRIARLLS